MIGVTRTEICIGLRQLKCETQNIQRKKQKKIPDICMQKLWSHQLHTAWHMCRVRSHKVRQEQLLNKEVGIREFYQEPFSELSWDWAQIGYFSVPSQCRDLIECVGHLNKRSQNDYNFQLGFTVQALLDLLPMISEKQESSPTSNCLPEKTHTHTHYYTLPKITEYSIHKSKTLHLTFYQNLQKTKKIILNKEKKSDTGPEMSEMM